VNDDTETAVTGEGGKTTAYYFSFKAHGPPSGPGLHSRGFMMTLTTQHTG